MKLFYAYKYEFYATFGYNLLTAMSLWAESILSTFGSSTKPT